MRLRLPSGTIALTGAVALGCAGEESSPSSRTAPAVAVESFTVTPDSVRLWYTMIGDGPQVVIVPNALYHGNRLDTLAGPSRRLVLYDPRGRGRSDSVPAERVSLDHLVEDFDAIRRAAGADSVAIIGWSGSGMEAFVYALRHPGRVTRLIQLAPVAPRWVPWADSLGSSRSMRTDSVAWSQLQARVQAGAFAGDPAAHCREQARVSNPASFGDTALARLAPDVCIYRNEWPTAIGAFFGALMTSLSGFDWRDDLARVTIPRLVIHGERDNTPLAGNCEWVVGQSTARLLVIRGAGHWPHYERPAETIEAMRAFLDGGWPAGSHAATAAAGASECAP
ncbi:MAG TPA: alpha/beta hydrolase [Gemmatimonadaceae bacterium]|nr:alpha/beta hydrolase [Gemmatimonadaceae bacterium]